MLEKLASIYLEKTALTAADTILGYTSYRTLKSAITGKDIKGKNQSKKQRILKGLLGTGLGALVAKSNFDEYKVNKIIKENPENGTYRLKTKEELGNNNNG